jgi:uncharacterized membrane protein
VTAVIVLKPSPSEGPGVTMWLRPNRSLSHRGMRRLGWGLAAGVLATALVWAWQGAVYAPLFALVEAAAAGWALDVAWHKGDRGERITLDARSLEVEALPGRDRTQFQSGWVRVRMQPGQGHQRLLLASHGRELEIGAFLGDEERTEASQKLKLLLAQVTAPQRHAGQTT